MDTELLLPLLQLQTMLLGSPYELQKWSGFSLVRLGAEQEVGLGLIAAGIFHWERVVLVVKERLFELPLQGKRASVSGSSFGRGLYLFFEDMEQCLVEMDGILLHWD